MGRSTITAWFASIATQGPLVQSYRFIPLCPDLPRSGEAPRASALSRGGADCTGPLC